MPENEAATEPAQSNDLWFLVALCLVIAAALMFLGALAQTLDLNHASTRARLEEITVSGLSVFTAALLLGAAVASQYARASHGRALKFAVAGGGLLVLAGALFSILDLFTVHVPNLSETSGSLSFAFYGDSSWKVRLAFLAPRLASGIVAIAALAVMRLQLPRRVAADLPDEDFV